MCRVLTFCGIACFAILFLAASSDAAINIDLYEPGQYEDPQSGSSLPYRLMKPANYDPNKSYPVVLYLHGYGSAGNDNTSQINSTLTYLDEHLKKPEYESFLLVPQIEAEWDNLFQQWSSGNWFDMTLDVLDEVIEEYNIDSSRQYVTGVSIGGFGTWGMIAQEPGRFAAAVPICGGGDTSAAVDISKTPVWTFHAANDGVVSVQYSRAMVSSLEAIEEEPVQSATFYTGYILTQTDSFGSSNYTEFTSGGHAIWDESYRYGGGDDAMYDWMFAQSVPEPSTWILLFAGLVAWFGLRKRASR
jgi:predicted peptidase